jgi:signal transduction histidine kinase
MAVLQPLIRLLSYTLGAALAVFLLLTVLGKRRAKPADRVLALALGAAALWFGTQALDLYASITVELGDSGLPVVLRQVKGWTDLLLPALVLHVMLLWAGAPRWAGLAPYAGAALAKWLSVGGDYTAVAVFVGAGLAGAAVAAFRASAHETGPPRRYLRTTALWLVLAAAVGGIRGGESALLAIVSVAPLVATASFVYRYNLFDLLISRRTAFVFALALVSAFYLFLVRQIAGYAEDRFEAFGAVVQVSLIFAVAVLWLPLYEWITRFLSRRGVRYAEISKQVIERAVGVLEMEQRIRFLAEEVGKLFQFRRVLLHKSASPQQYGTYGCGLHPDLVKGVDSLRDAAARTRPEFIHVLGAEDPSQRELLERLGFHYAIPLWYGEQLTGILLVDASPRLYLDENEPILLGLSRQIAHSLEACRQLEERINLEKAVVRQEQLATLGLAAAAIAHEVKNPLSSIKTLAQLMREDREINATYQRDLAYIVAETDRLNAFVRQLLSFARPSAHSAVISVHEFLNAAAPILQRVSAERRIRIEHQVEPALAGLVVNRQALQHVVTNLVENAIDASPANATVRIEAGLEPPVTIRIAVTDAGPGIPEEMQEKIFEPFFTNKPGGTGLGLPIVKKNVEELEGQIWVVSPVVDGQGSSFVVTFPGHPVSA